MQETNFMGYLIPKDTQVFMNAWAIRRDPECWEDPMSFKPERFLGSNIEIKGQNFVFIPFGSGRRICVGFLLAERVLHLGVASLLYYFDWELGKDVTPESTDMNERMGINCMKDPTPESNTKGACHVRAIMKVCNLHTRKWSTMKQGLNDFDLQNIEIKHDSKHMFSFQHQTQSDLLSAIPAIPALAISVGISSISLIRIFEPHRSNLRSKSPDFVCYHENHQTRLTLAKISIGSIPKEPIQFSSKRLRSIKS
ncbi:hypothetical protein Q3G72_009683 [Acer saccharum]|nr:hypothetical protein Q3G72_009683 [Acer saccharum]